MTDQGPRSEGEYDPSADAGAARSSPTRVKTLLRWAPLIFLILGGITISVLGLSEDWSLSSIIEGRSALLDYFAQHPTTTIAIYSGAYVLAVVFSVPGGFLLTVLSGIIFGGVIGGLIATIAVTFGSVCVFLIARTALGDWMRRWVDKLDTRATNFAEGFRTNAFYVIVVLRLVPVMPYWASNALPALFGVRLRVFIAATLVGLLPWTVSFAFFGAAIDEILGAQEVTNPGCAAAGTCELDFSAMTSGPVIAGLVIALLSLIPVFGHWWSRRRKRAANESAKPAPEV